MLLIAYGEETAMSLHPTSLIGFLTGSQAPKEERRPIGMPAANVVGEGFFYKEGANVKTWKYRKFTVFDNGHLMYFSPMRKLFKGELPIKAVVLSSPARGSRMTRPIDVMLGEEAFELQVKSLAAVRPLNLLFRTDEEGMLFLYYLSLACTVHNVPVRLSMIILQELSV